MAVVGIFGFNAMFFYGLRYTSSVNGSVVMALNPTITVVLSSLVVGEAIKRRTVLGLALSLVGVLIVVTNASLDMLRGFHFSLGELLILIGNICWATYAVIGRRYIQKGTPLQTSAVTMVLGALLLCALAGARGDLGSIFVQPLPILASIAFMAFFGSVLAYFGGTRGSRRSGGQDGGVLRPRAHLDHVDRGQYRPKGEPDAGRRLCS